MTGVAWFVLVIAIGCVMVAAAVAAARSGRRTTEPPDTSPGPESPEGSKSVGCIASVLIVGLVSMISGVVAFAAGAPELGVLLLVPGLVAFLVGGLAGVAGPGAVVLALATLALIGGTAMSLVAYSATRLDCRLYPDLGSGPTEPSCEGWDGYVSLLAIPCAVLGPPAALTGAGVLLWLLWRAVDRRRRSSTTSEPPPLST